MSAFLHESFRLLVGVHSLRVLRLVVPVDLELGNSWLFSENVPSKAGDVRSLRGILVHFWVVVFNVHVVADAHELLVVLIGAS